MHVQSPRTGVAIPTYSTGPTPGQQLGLFPGQQLGLFPGGNLSSLEAIWSHTSSCLQSCCVGHGACLRVGGTQQYTWSPAAVHAVEAVPVEFSLPYMSCRRHLALRMRIRSALRFFPRGSCRWDTLNTFTIADASFKGLSGQMVVYLSRLASKSKVDTAAADAALCSVHKPAASCSMRQRMATAS